MGHGLDIRSEITADHALLALLVRRLAEGRGRAAPDRALLGRATAALARHRAITERYLYAELREYAPESTELTARGRRELDEAARTLGRLTAGDDPAPAGELLSTLAAQLRRHARHEEEVVLPALEQCVMWPVLEDLGRKAHAARTRVLTPQSWPDSPGRGPGGSGNGGSGDGGSGDRGRGAAGARQPYPDLAYSEAAYLDAVFADSNATLPWGAHENLARGGVSRGNVMPSSALVRSLARPASPPPGRDESAARQAPAPVDEEARAIARLARQAARRAQGRGRAARLAGNGQAPS